MNNTCVQQVELGFRIFGVDQCEYAVDGVQGKTIGQAVGLASINRALALEQAMNGYVALVNAHNQKIDDLSEILAVLAGTRAQYDAEVGEDDIYYTSERYKMLYSNSWIKNDDELVALLDKYGIQHSCWNGGKLSASDIDKIQSDVSYQVDNEDNDLQSDVASLQNYVTKRDDAYATAGDLQGKCDDSISSQMQYMGA